MTAITRTELLHQLTDHARTLGWDVVEWNWKDDVDGVSEYQMWIQPADEEGQR